MQPPGPSAACCTPVPGLLPGPCSGGTGRITSQSRGFKKSRASRAPRNAKQRTRDAGTQGGIAHWRGAAHLSLSRSCSSLSTSSAACASTADSGMAWAGTGTACAAGRLLPAAAAAKTSVPAPHALCLFLTFSAASGCVAQLAGACKCSVAAGRPEFERTGLGRWSR